MPTKQRYCCICQNHGQKWIGDQKVTMHRFPVDPRRRRVWIQRCNTVMKDFKFGSYDGTRICSVHFVGGRGPTPTHNLPSIFPQKDFKISCLDENIPDGHENDVTEIKKSEDYQDNNNNPIDIGNDPIEHLSESEVDTELTLPSNSSVLDVSLTMHDYCGAHVTPSTRCQITQTESLEVISVSTQTEFCTLSKYETASQTPIITTREIGIQVTTPDLTFEDIMFNDEKVMFYTGIPHSKTFEIVFDELKQNIDVNTATDKGRPRVLRHIDEFFMVLMRLRLGLLLGDLSERFKISISTCGNIFNKWIDYLDVQLSCLVPWPSRQIIDNTMPKSFKANYPNCRVVIDCTEIKTETPSSLQLRSLLYSDYKSHMTFKSLIGISPRGVVTFVSDLFTGSVSDKQITKLSGLIDLCEEGDAIMADKGFVISDLTTPKGISFIIPPFKRKKRQLSKREVTETRSIANLRIHVEREMERIKNFRIVQGNMPITMASQSSKIWKTCVRLTNLQPPLVLK